MIRPARESDRAAAYFVCLKTGDHGLDGEPYYREDPDALGRIYVGPYLTLEPDFSFVLEDAHGVCGYVLGARDSRAFYDRYEHEWRPRLCDQFRAPSGDPRAWTRVQQAYRTYHHPDYFCPEPYAAYPSHLHIDLLPRAQGRGNGRRMVDCLLAALARHGSPGVHLGVSVQNTRARAFYERIGFRELTRVGDDRDGCIYMGRELGLEARR